MLWKELGSITGPCQAAYAIERAGGAAQRLHMAAEQVLLLPGRKAPTLEAVQGSPEARV